jgi:hypothetical protein
MVVVLQGATASKGDESRIPDLREDHLTARSCAFIAVARTGISRRLRSSCPSPPDNHIS